MSNFSRFLAPLALAMTLAVPAWAAEEGKAPWGRAEAPGEADYAPHKVVYDVAVEGRGGLEGVIDRASYLNKLYRADPFASSIVLVLHGGEIPLFAVENQVEYGELMRRAQSLTVAGPVEFRMCTLAARAHGYEPGDIHGFVKMVPMADAEIVRLQREEGYAYMR